MATISEVELKHGNKGDYWRIKADNQWISVFDKALGQQLAVGKETTEIGRIVRKGDNGEFVNLEPFPAQAPKPNGHPHEPNPPKEVTQVGRVLDARDASIQRQCALKAASAYAAACVPFESVDKTGVDVSALASYFLTWLLDAPKDMPF